jgi:energy-coupling factor transporter ATP-binding protein EcfA2
VPPGLCFRNVDLHVHTPASHCFTASGVTPELLVGQAVAAGMHAIAVTDHNTAEWVDAIREAAAGKGLTVFPGVEITVQPGVHVLAIFPQDCGGAHVTDLLSNLGLRAADRGSSEAVVTEYGVQRVVTIIRDHKALPILAHVDAPRGAWRELRGSGQTLISLWQAAEFAAVEIVSDVLPAEVGQAPYEHRPACYWASDNPDPQDPIKHSHLGIGTRYSRFKLGDPITWEGLRQCFQDPEVRIRPGRSGDDHAVGHPIIERVQVEGGFLGGLDLWLNPNLNCIIGGRGTGKSALLELIRHAFDTEAKTQENLRQGKGIVDHTFPAGSRVTVQFRLGDGTAYRIQRSAGCPPQVFREGDEAQLALSPANLLPIQVYGQKEVYEISRDPTFQLRLLDNYVAEALKPLRAEEDDLLRRLRDNAASILHLQDDIDKARDRLGDLEAIKEELRRMKEQDFVTRIEQKRLYDQEKRLLDQAQEQLDHLVQVLSAFPSEHSLDLEYLADEATQGLPNLATLQGLRDLLLAIGADVEQTLPVLQARIEAKWAEGQAARDAWEEAYQKQNEAYQALLREFQASGKALKADRYIQLEKKKRELETLQQTVQNQEAQVARLMATRRELLESLRAVRRRMFEIRRDKAAELTQSLGRAVRITLHPQAHREAFRAYLKDVFGGLDVRNPHRDRLAQAEADEPEQQAARPVKIGGETVYLVPRIPRYLDPIDLADAIRAEQAQPDAAQGALEAQFKIDSEPMRRNMTKLSPGQLFDLETFAVPDLPVIELKVAGGELGYRPLSALSVGQKCTALLSPILLESPATLLIDQPEDDLDNQFIFDQIVATLRREKEQRQFLVATHNANIPVSGDAELIVVLQADEKRGWVEPGCVGSIDSDPIKQYVERILEGGEAAFRIRKEKYGIR